MKRKILSVLAALSLGGPSVLARAQESEAQTQDVRNALGAVRVVRDATETLVRIEGSRVPVFSIYTLQDPLRLVVDVSQGEVDKLDTPLDVDDGVLTKVVAAQYGEGKRAVGRIIIGFSRRVPYDVKAEGNAVVVRIAAVGKERPSEASLRERDKRIESQEAELTKLRQALEARATAAADAEKRVRDELATRETDSQKLKEKDGEVAKLRADLVARAKEAAETREAAALAEKARAAEGEKRQELEQKLADAEKNMSSLREKAAGSEGMAAALEKARAEVIRAAKELAELRSEIATRADAETKARGEAAEAAKTLVRAQTEMSALRAELGKADSSALDRARAEAKAAKLAIEDLRREAAAAAAAKGESKKLVQRLFAAESRLKEIEALKGRMEGQGNAEQAKELIAHKTGEIEALRKKLAAAEGVAKATAAELDRVRREEAARVESAEAAHQGAQAQVAKAQGSITSENPSSGAAKVTLSSGQAPKVQPVVVRNVDFKSKEGNSRVVLRVDGEPNYVVHRSGDKKLVLDLPGARLPSHLRRKLDVSEFGGPVSVVSAYESSNPVQATRVTVELRGPAHYDVRRDGQNLELEVKSEGAAATTAKPLLLAQAGGAGAKDEVPEVLEEKRTAPKLRKRSRGKKAVYRGRRINLDLQDADIHTVLKLVSEVIRLNFVVSDDVKGKVSMTLRDVPWDQALDIILKAKELGYVREGNIVRVALEKVLRKEAAEEAQREVVVKESQPILLKIIPVNYAKVADMQARVKDVLSDKGAVSSDARTNQLIVRDIQQRIRAAERLVKKLDTQTPQVLIEARIVEANTIFSREIGIQWGGTFEASPANGNPTGLVFPSTIGVGGGAPLGLSTAQGILNPAAPNFGVNLPATTGLNQGGAVGFTFGNIGGTVNLNLRLSAAEENGQAKIISAPKITTLDNQKATIQQGVSIPIAQSSALGTNTIFVDANLTLTVTPHVTLDGSVMMDIIATKNEPDFQRVGGLGDPTIIRKEARTSVLIKDGDTTVIGGIYTRNQSTNFREVPLLSKIPILGWLFKKNLKTDNRTELLIFITPRIVNRPDSIGT